MGWFDDAVDAVSSTADSVYDAGANAVSSAATSVDEWLGEGANTADAATGGGNELCAEDEPDSWWGGVGQTIGDFGRGLQQEGASGLLDPSGMLDRQDAQRDLSDRFQVVGDDFTGPRNHNQVSQAEYERIAATFSDIRTGRGDLTLDSSSFRMGAGEDQENWETGMQVDIANMMQTTAGRNQIFDLSDNVARTDDGTARTNWYGGDVHHHTTIKPFFGQWEGENSENEDGFDEAPWWNRDDDTMRNDNARANALGPGYERTATGARGQGADAEVFINPGQVFGVNSDVILAHELQHARGITQGTNATGDMHEHKNPDRVPNAERQAVGLSRTDGHYPGDADGCSENTYRQQRNDLGDRYEPRTGYGSKPNEAEPGVTDEQLQSMWDEFYAGGNAPHHH